MTFYLENNTLDIDLYSIHGTNQHLRELQGSVPISWLTVSPILMAYGYVHLYPKKSPKITSVRCEKIFSIQKKHQNQDIQTYHQLIGGFNPSEKYESQLGLLFPIYGTIKFMFQITNQKISPVLDIRNGASNHQYCFKSPQQIPAFLSISQIPCKK